jgi:hypothetical protein
VSAKPVILTLAVCLAGGQAAGQTGHALSCPTQAPAEWGAGRQALVGVDVLSAKRDEPIDETAPPSLIPDQQATRAGTLHQVWRMNGDGPDWLFYVWCRYAGTDRILKLAAPGVRRCERLLPAAHPDRPPQQMVCD